MLVGTGISGLDSTGPLEQCKASPSPCLRLAHSISLPEQELSQPPCPRTQPASGLTFSPHPCRLREGLRGFGILAGARKEASPCAGPGLSAPWDHGPWLRPLPSRWLDLGKSPPPNPNLNQASCDWWSILDFHHSYLLIIKHI